MKASQGIDVIIEPTEFASAALGGFLRWSASAFRGWKVSRQSTPSPWRRLEADVLGAAGEIAVAKHLNRFFVPSVNTFKNKPDVGAYEVRTSEGHDRSLILREGDPLDRVFILVTFEEYIGRIHGWTIGSDVAEDRYIRNPSGRGKAWFVPSSALQPINKLPQ